MKFCKNCGKELIDEAVFCTHCGHNCAAQDPAPNYAPSAPSSNASHPIVKSSYLQILLMSVIGGPIFGAIMGFYCSILFEVSFLKYFLMCAIIFAALFFGAMSAVTAILEGSTFKKMSNQIAQRTRIYFEGTANRKGNGGMLYATDNGLEHYPHKVNFDSSGMVIPYNDIISVSKKGANKLAVNTVNGEIVFNVNNMKVWMSLFAQHEPTKNKIL